MRAFGTILITIAALLLVGLAASPGGPEPAATQEEPSLSEEAVQGRLLYRIYCLNCHGDGGRGDGPTSRVMSVPPADLTRLKISNAGSFPAERVMRTIDGRHVVPGHGDRTMPIWGLSMQEPGRDTDQEPQIRTKLRQLARYLEAIQSAE